MKTRARLIALAILGSSSLSAAPFMAVGDNAELFLTASVGVAVDDNIYLRPSNEIDDTILTFTPGLDLVFGRNSATSGNLYYRHEILRYTDVSAQDTELAHLGFNALYNNGKTKLDAGAAYDEFAQNDPSVPGAIVERDVTALRLLGEFGATEKTSVGLGFRYDSTDYALGGSFRDSDIWSIPLDVYFEYSPKLQVSVGYRYRSTDMSGAAIDNDDHFFNVGARGEFTPKLSGQVRVGFVSRDFDNNTDDSSIGLEMNLSYTLSDKTGFTFGVTNDFGNSALGESTESFSVNLGANTRVTEQWSWNAGIVSRSVDYPTRSDDFVQGTVGVAYTYNSFVNFAANYAYRSNSSGQQAFEFDNSVFSLAANIRY